MAWGRRVSARPWQERFRQDQPASAGLGCCETPLACQEAPAGGSDSHAPGDYATDGDPGILEVSDLLSIEMTDHLEACVVQAGRAPLRTILLAKGTCRLAEGIDFEGR